MYIPAVPAIPKNVAYVQKQKEHFLKGAPPPDFPQDEGEVGFRGIGTDNNILSDTGKRAMGFEVSTSA